MSRVVLWPGVVIAALLFLYAASTPIRVAGHEVLSLPIYNEFPTVTSWFRGSGRFAWPLYYLVMALALAQVARGLPIQVAFTLMSASLILQVMDTRPLRAFVRRDVTYPWPELESPAWTDLGKSFRSIKLVPPIVANRIACRQYDREYDFEIRFGVVAAREHMTFNSGNPARVDSLAPLCIPMLDSLKLGLLDPATVYVPDASYREALEWWGQGRIVCGTLDGANVCVARPASGAVPRLTQVLAREDQDPPTKVLNFDLRGGEEAAFVDSTLGFSTPDTNGSPIAYHTAVVYLSHPIEDSLDLTVEASTPKDARPTPLTVIVGRQSRTLLVHQRAAADTLHFSHVGTARTLRFALPDAGTLTADDTIASDITHVWIRHLTIRLR